MAEDRKIALGITGCIAAYKSAEILRGLQKAGFDVEVAMTSSACDFIGPTTFAALSGHAVCTMLTQDQSDIIPHVRIGKECSAYLIAPCTANMLGKLAAGIADDAVSTIALVASEKLIVAPAMNTHMYESKAVQQNLAILEERGTRIIDATSGMLACKDVGKGKLADVDAIVDEVARAVGSPSGPLSGKRAFVTCGPTYEAIDPVRSITNGSTGKMGTLVAKALRDAGADVTLALGRTTIPAPPGMDVRRFVSAEDLMRLSSEEFPKADIGVFAAAVSDYKPEIAFARKLKKGSDDASLSNIRLVPNPDILKACASEKMPGQVVVGFAAETEGLEESAMSKLAAKGADAIVANLVSDDSGIASDSSVAMLATKSGILDLGRIGKEELALKLVECVEGLM